MTPDQDHQSTIQKVATVTAGLGGISLSMADISTLAQQIGMIVGCILVCGQAVVFFRGAYKRWKKSRPSNDR